MIEGKITTSLVKIIITDQHSTQTYVVSEGTVLILRRVGD